MKKLVTELQAGDVIDPPQGEKCWLWRDGVKRKYTVVSTKPGKITKKGEFTKITAMCPSPYNNQSPSEHRCEMLSNKLIKIHVAQ